MIDGRHPPQYAEQEMELREHFGKISGGKFLNLEEKLANAKEYVHRMEFGDRTFTHDNEADKRRPISISPSQPNVSAVMAPVLFEGDIILNERQIDAILRRLKKLQNKNRRKPSPQRTMCQHCSSSKRSINADPDTFWHQMPIKFHLHDSLDLTAIQQIANAIAFWENNTCVTFEHLDREPSAAEEKEEDFVDFFKGHGCYSMIGRSGGRQGVSIGSGCERLGIVEHEIGHVLGLWHEQSRPDAWKYIKVEKEFVLPSYLSDFQLRDDDEIMTLGLPYDYGSVMHYGPTAFSTDGTSQTLIAKDMLFQSTIGQRDQFAFYDVMAINKAYCADKCGGIAKLQQSDRPLSVSDPQNQHASPQAALCLNDGYPNPSRCSECICPNGYGGKQCERAQQAQNANCGGELTVGTDKWAQLESPGYSEDGYEVGQQCNWVVRSPQGTRILVEFVDDFSMFCGNICLDYVELKLAMDQRLTGARFCCNERFAGQMVSEHNQMAILFRAQLSQDIGFRMRLRATQLPAAIHRMNNNTDDRTTEKQKKGTTEVGRKTFLPGNDIWGEWGPWSECSRPCGGCGIRSRTRSCLSERCIGDKSLESSACNFVACPIRPDCRKALFMNRFCPQLEASSATSQKCTENLRLMTQCNQPSCCPPFYALNGKCVQTENEN
ncbi:hypothetical protein niasHS_007341 [Heterodera schachtii]|uniref:Zinc metalloproteinase n=1 Tax=Heterodera schachtii TaxID=97005 RepID=A0ABD2JK19_HETSC